jgi:hypothetical protein
MKIIRPKVSIIILNWNGLEDTINCIESLKKIEYPNYDLIVVDNNSNIDPTEEIKARFPDVIVIRNDKNLGVATGNNVGIRYALKKDTKYILLLNNDIMVKKNFLKELVKVADLNKTIGTVGPKILSPNSDIQRACTRRLPTFLDFIFVYSFIGERLLKENRFWRKHFYYDYNFDSPKEVEVLSGSCMLIKKETIEDIGLFDENTFLYFEEFIMGVKFKKKGWKSMVNPKSEIVHLGGETVKNLNLKSWARYWSKRSEFYFLKKYSGMRKIRRALISTILLIEAFSALSFAIVERNKGDFDVKNELKIIKFLMNELF